MSANIVCPSGLAGQIRGLKGKEGALLADRAAARAGLIFDRILAACWEATTDPGIYDFSTDGAPDWSKVLVGDRFFTLLKIRSLTFGDEYPFSVQCDSPACRERFEWTLELKDLPVRSLSPAAKAAFRAGNRIETKLPADSRRVWFRLMTGADEVKAASVIRGARDSLLITALLARIVEIENVAESDKRAFLEDMEMADAAALLERFDEADGGVETTIHVECPSCLGIMDVELPFERGFFLPKAKAKKASG